jgi:hypothetical protein
MLYRGKRSKNQAFRKKFSMEPLQYNGGLLGLQKREYLAKTHSLRKFAVWKTNRNQALKEYLCYEGVLGMVLGITLSDHPGCSTMPTPPMRTSFN